MKRGLDEQYMRLALDLAKAQTGQTSPNPLVGAVIVKEHQIVGLGAHLKAGEPHAEVHALRMAETKAQGATMYVTLEPCSHYGRTPPCADQLIEAGIKRVVVAALDPNPLVSGSGVQRLAQAGVEVETGVLAQEAEAMNEVFNYFIQHKKPFVTLKTATTLDGKIATVTGESQWITGEQARADVHALRHQNDAILVGVNTVIKDNPRLTTRLGETEGRHPIRIILDSSLRTPLDAQILDTSTAPTWIFTTKSASDEKRSEYLKRGVRVFQTEDEKRVSIENVLLALGKEQVSSLLVEGGGEVNAAFLQGRHVQKVVAYVAPLLIGGHLAPTSFRGEGFAALTDAVRLTNMSLEMLGEDLKLTGYLSEGGDA